ncbi:Na/Pi symporter [Actinospongicola halichondriae]|uniref:Na/Pi symporter n=1 Tax=Actinospongicola halichondriae TaxID=3236844 RepID=UPI003D4C6189
MAHTEQSDSDSGAIPAFARGIVVVGLLYLFLIGVSLLEGGIKSLGSDIQEELFSSVTNPVAGLCVGILATVLAQSSSVTTSTIVGLVGSGLLGVDAAVPMIMGANIGTTVTNTLASLGHVRRSTEFKEAFAAATVHDYFNLLAVSILLPLELVTGILSKTAEALTDLFLGGSGATFESPIKQAVKEPASLVESAWEAVGASGSLLGVLLLFSGLACIFLALAFITKNMRALVADRVEASINAFLSRGGGVTAMAMGLVITIAVQSSSITTSVMIPLAASGVVTLANIYPVTLGANVGTTITALLASLATGRPEALTVALVHTLFNLAGILLFYPVPAMRALPIRLAHKTGELASRRASAVIAYIAVVFILIPALGVIVLR